MAQYTGKVIWFSNAKGCGYLSRCGYPDVFIHFSAVIPDCYEGLSAGDEVTFDIIQGTKGHKWTKWFDTQGNNAVFAVVKE